MAAIAAKNMTGDFHFTKEEILREEEDIRAAVANSAQFATLYNRYYTRIYRYIFKRVSDEDFAADITQQAFIKAMQNLPGYRFMGLPFASWLYRIARNELLVELRKQNKYHTVNITDAGLADVSTDTEIEDTGSRIQMVVGALRGLSDEELELVEMKYFEGRQYSEICEILGISENNAKSKVFRAIRKMRKLINQVDRTHDEEKI